MKSSIPVKLRLAAYLCPPAGLLLVWRNPHLSFRRKTFATFGLLLYSIIYATGVVALMMRFTALQLEWRGGFPPVLTYEKTVPNYAAVEASRASQKSLASNVKSSSPAQTANYWTGFRGPKRDGLYDEQPISTNWPATGLPLIWKQPCGSGYASFAVAEGLAFTIEQRREQEVVAAYDIETGQEIWTHSYNAQFEESMGGEGPRATPVYHDGKVYSLGALGHLFCLEARTGEMLWQKNIVADNQAELLTYAHSASPLVVDDKLIVCPGGQSGKSVVAYDKTSGAPLWKSLDDNAAYSSPMLVELAGQRQLLIATEKRIAGLDVENGELLWTFPWIVNQGNRNIAQPVLLGPNRFLVSAGYGTGCAAIEIARGGSHFSVKELWRNKNLKNKFTSSVFWNGFVYGLDEDILVCLDAQTGQRRWKDGRYGYGQLVLASGHLVILAGNGQLALVKADSEKYEELFRFQAIQGKTWNHPALAGGKLFVRNMVEMACFDISARP